MRVPGFSADSSLLGRSGYYRRVQFADSHGGPVVASAIRGGGEISVDDVLGVLPCVRGCERLCGLSFYCLEECTTDCVRRLPA